MTNITTKNSVIDTVTQKKINFKTSLYNSKKQILFLVISVFYSSFLLAQPKIINFTPKSAKPGDTVTITGAGFNSIAANNIVFFGATRATITAATAVNIKTIVPIGATYAPITLLNLGTSLAAYSGNNFTPTFSPAKTSISATDFLPKQDFTTGTNPELTAIGDLDGDGKPDLVVANQVSSTVSVFRNIAVGGNKGISSFANKVDFATGSLPVALNIADLDGDGKLDIAVLGYSSYSVSVLRNQSVMGIIDSNSFAGKVDFSAGITPISLAIADFDGDGKPDIATLSNFYYKIYILRNTATIGSISAGSFASKVEINSSYSSILLTVGDLNGDGKTDLVTGAGGIVSVHINTENIGIINEQSFSNKISFDLNQSLNSLTLGDLDGDDKPDLVVTFKDTNTVSILRNTTTNASIDSTSFATKFDLINGPKFYDFTLSDLTGDGKPDLIGRNISSNFDTTIFSIFRNIASSGIFDSSSFAAKVNVLTLPYDSELAIGDLDGDSKPDLTALNTDSNKVSVVLNAEISNNADLSNLILSSGTLNPNFASTNTSYSANVSNATANITVTPTKAEANATITVNGITVSSGSASNAIVLNVGSNIITVIVTAQDGITQKTYTITVTRAMPLSNNADLSNLILSSGTLNPTFVSANTSYTANVSNTIASINVTPTKAEANATITVNGTTASSGSASNAVALNVGSNIITVIVTAQDGITQKTYTITVTRAMPLSNNADLNNLILSAGTLNPNFASTNTSYSANVSNATANITVTPTKAEANATITVNGITVSSGSASNAIALNVGSNIITVVVTAQDGTVQKTYTVTVTRATTSVKTSNTLSLFKIYPNPNGGILNIELENSLPSSITIYNQVGKMVYQKEITGLVNQLDISKLSNGSYFVYIKQGDKTSIRPLLIDK